MYQHWFGFKERPFKLVPDPDYLYLSQSHEEALAHLKYAVMSGEGFVELVGEVGTGKTLLCRVFLENMGQDVETAYIFNPGMDAGQLIERINSEFGIDTDAESANARIDALNSFLIKQKTAGRKSILLIDEAQNLSRSALEQIRMLTNLETKKEKLLQIVLVGQPELGELLDTYELRQLAQRVTLSCRLRPFNLMETEAYINHRLYVAACKPVRIFSKLAVREIYRFCRGVPRLTNIACDRALLAAYAENKRRVTRAIAKTVIREFVSRGDMRSRNFSNGWQTTAIAGSVVLILFFGLFLYQGKLSPLFTRSSTAEGPSISKHTEAKNDAGHAENRDSTPVSPQHRRSTAVGQTLSPPEPGVTDTGNQRSTVSADIQSTSVNKLKDLLQVPAETDSRHRAAESAISRWVSIPKVDTGYAAVDNDDIYFELVSRLNGLRSLQVDKDLTLIQRLNLPAVLKMIEPERKTPVYLVVCKAGSNSFAVSRGKHQPCLSVSFQELKTCWSGTAYVLWKNFYHYQGTIPLDANEDSVVTLKMHLRDLGFEGLSTKGDYDLPTRRAVKTIQAGQGIPVDGFVGPLTQIVLYNQNQALPIPHLNSAPETGPAG